MAISKWQTGALMVVVMVLLLGGAVGLQAHDESEEPEPESPEQQLEPTEQQPRRCNDRILRGRWGIQIEGTRPSAPGGPVESVIGVVYRRYDGEGNFTQIDNVKGSISGITPDRPGFGTYEVDGNCMATTFLVPGPGILIEERFVIVDNGEGAFGIGVHPPPLNVSSVHRRMRW
jgi:hypothetical protein